MPTEQQRAFISSLVDLRGRPVLEFFPLLCSLHQEITGIRFETYRPAPGLSERLENNLTSIEKSLRDVASTLRDTHGIPFWDAMLATAMQQGTINERFIRSALEHDNAPDEQEIFLRRDEVTAERVADIISKLRNGYGLAVSSKVTLRPSLTAHIPMLDFRCPWSDENVRALKTMLTLLGSCDGILVESGRSYHFYGTDLLGEQEWIRFMGRALLFAPIVDSRFIGHRLVDGRCRLKVADPRNGFKPRIADAFISYV